MMVVTMGSAMCFEAASTICLQKAGKDSAPHIGALVRSLHWLEENSVAAIGSVVHDIVFLKKRPLLHQQTMMTVQLVAD